MGFQKAFDLLIANHLQSIPEDQKREVREQFRENSVSIIDFLLPEPLKAAFSAEGKYLMADFGKRRDLVMKVSGNTPRHYLSVGRDHVHKYGKLIPAFFHSQVVVDFLTYLNADEPVYKVPYTPEEYIINRQHAVGDTHGWHWDDYTFALIWMVEAPSEGDGAVIEYIPHTEWDKSDYSNCVNKVLANNEVRSLYVPTDACYFMKASTTLHRVTPLAGSSRRTVIIFTYASAADLAASITHETMEQIYPDDTNIAAG